MSAQVISVACNHCGAPLEVSESTRFVTCTFCSSRLEIVRSGNAAFTQVLEKIEQKVDDLGDDLEVIKLQNEIERLDREWQMKRESFMVSDKDGHSHVPSRSGGVVGAVVAIIFGIGFFGFASAGPLGQVGGGGIGCVGLAICVVAALIALSSIFKVDRYEKAQQQYERRRRVLVSQLDGLKRQ